MRFATSSTAFRSAPLEEAVRQATEAGLTLEFSSGLAHRPDLVDVFRRAPCTKLVHNYFPAPREGFVLNLASRAPELLERSRAHCEQGLRLASEAGSPFYSVHAGFCVDPDPSQLGRPFGAASGDREASWRVFVESVRTILPRARALACELLIENNVVAGFNAHGPDRSPLLCADGQEMARLFADVGEPAELGVLLDTGHLKVSARTLGFAPEAFFEHVGARVRAIHHSDNDGLTDSNQPLGPDYWFLAHIPRFAGAHHILEVHDQDIAQIEAQRRLLASACGEPA